MKKILTLLSIITLFYCNTLFAQTYRTSDKKYSVVVSDYRQSGKINISIKLYKGDVFKPTLIKTWSNHEKQYIYVGKSEKFKFILVPILDNLGGMPKFTLAVFNYSNGFDKMFTETLFSDVYYLAS